MSVTRESSQTQATKASKLVSICDVMNLFVVFNEWESLSWKIRSRRPKELLLWNCSWLMSMTQVFFRNIAVVLLPVTLLGNGTLPWISSWGIYKIEKKNHSYQLLDPTFNYLKEITWQLTSSYSGIKKKTSSGTKTKKYSITVGVAMVSLGIN